MLIIPLIGLISVPDGCRSTSLTLLGKELQQKKLTYMELVVQILSLGCIIIAALVLGSIWALLIGDLCSAIVRTAWSHAINTDHPNRLTLEKESIRELLGFGKWIMVSTAMMFLASQADRLMLGKLFSMTLFGVYSIALALAELPKQVISRLNGKVIYPLITKYSHLTHEELLKKMKIPRFRLLLALAILLACFGTFSDIAIYILYDRRYQDAAWILPMLAFGMWPLLLISTIEGSLLAIGKPKYAATGNLAKFIYMITVLPLSFRIGGQFGAVLAIALNDLPSYAIISVGLTRERLSLLKQDLVLTLVLVLATALLMALRVVTGMGVPGHSMLFLP
jgi:O-antigen/teichoic acid export membrane protein